MNTLKSRFVAGVAALALALSFASTAQAWTPDADEFGAQTRIMKQVRKQLVTLPYYGVFDNLAYKVEGATVTLYGQVTRPSTRKDAERRVAKIQGIERVVNNIEVLPLSGFDDELRVRTYRTVFGTGSLYRYARGVNPSIHIIVNRGHVTLEGVVGSTMDKQLAEMAARSVSGAFSVTNNLRAESEERRAG